jgi:hopene-associated glycosyltransferase HpnB
MGDIGLGITALSLAIWVGLFLFRGQFWRTDWQLPDAASELSVWPAICAVIPARNEAEVLPMTLRSLLSQDYPGVFTILLVDDQSTDGTAQVARQIAADLGTSDQLQVLMGEPLPSGWTGKLWAMDQGTRQAQILTPSPDYILLTDADIEHDPLNLRRLVTKAQTEQLDLVSLMVKLRCQSVWEHLLIPAFVFFFQKLYPFRWVNDPNNDMAAAAGGCILLSRDALSRIGGLHVLQNALIDDCTLAQKVKSSRRAGEASLGQNRVTGIWLGLTTSTYSLRPYDSLQTIWDMVVRTAFTQLHYSPWLLLGTLLAMTLVYLVPPLGVLVGGITGAWPMAITGLAAWTLMSLAYWPMIRFYGCSGQYALYLPAIALLYTLMTVDSALRHWRGQGGAWKGRVYSNASSDLSEHKKTAA